MAVTARRRLDTNTTRRFGSGRDPYAIPDLTEIQTKSYARFLQYETTSDKRKDEGLEGVLREIFPIESYDKKLQLQYLRYELGKPRYEPDECRQLRLTYGRPFRIWLRLNKEQPIEEEVYLGDLPIMLAAASSSSTVPSAWWSASCIAAPVSTSSPRWKPASAASTAAV
jgi:DNA-directed RNA polymerase subunit beta